ncbi:MAG: hypothetical protein PHH08_00735 [Candidatus ainarchaeum sp.]|nr:hypothetical protein [Candidatus ainarchaeum sp.]
MLSENQLKKKAIFFGLDDILIPGLIDRKVDKKEVEKIIHNLEKIKKNSKNFFWGVVSGYTKEAGMKKLKESCIEKYYCEENFFFVEPDYIEGKETFDREVHLKKLSQDAFFQDEFFKKILIEKEISKRGISKEETIFVGHDLMFDAYYLWKFGQIDCALLKEAFSEKNKKRKEIIKSMIYIRRNWDDIQKLLLGKFPKPDYSFMETAVLLSLKQELMDLPEIKRVVIERKKEKEEQAKKLE